MYWYLVRVLGITEYRAILKGEQRESHVDAKWLTPKLWITWNCMIISTETIQLQHFENWASKCEEYTTQNTNYSTGTTSLRVNVEKNWWCRFA